MIALMLDEEEIADSVIDDVIKNWRASRLSDWFVSLPLAGDGLMGKVKDMGPAAVAASRGQSPKLPDSVSEADRVQRVVENMPDEIRTSFEAYHLAIILGDRCEDMPHGARAIILGISRPTYYRRVQYGRNIIRDWYTAKERQEA